MRIVIALGGNALLRRGQAITAQNQLENIAVAARSLANIATENEIVITHGNGPQIGQLALQSNAYRPDETYPLEMLGAQTDGMIGYMIEQALSNLLPANTPLATLLTRIEIDPSDPAFGNLEKFIGPVYTKSQAEQVARTKGWQVRADGEHWRRVVASPQPKRIVQIEPIKWLIEKGTVVICAGGGGIPTAYRQDGKSHGVDAVIDKDFASELLAREIAADLFVSATDVPAVFLNWRAANQQAIKRTNPALLRDYQFAAGSMRPKVLAASQFAEATGKAAAIGSMSDLESIVAGIAGTTISDSVGAMECYD